MPYDDSIIDLVRTALLFVLKISGPILAAGVVVGLLISIAQSVTQIQDQALSFVPKIIAMIFVAALLIPWIVQRVVEYSQALFVLK